MKTKKKYERISNLTQKLIKMEETMKKTKMRVKMAKVMKENITKEKKKKEK